ncbi:hypothetical protein [Butyrivibrio sp. INlla21]|uniref:hypothetical protein n=1 Tax=Butyrivibrio sp. INlla21 TaxID=1520811 RepID=UPI0008EFDF9D|nr:hypothetical protein [Butyrivibrio sp. INlla21]SFU57397.1 hypothetical protein SAMN02910342_00943 [Butyrivibrio sp. INlla21]
MKNVSKRELLAEYIRNQLEAEDVEIYLDVEDYKTILEELTPDVKAVAIKDSATGRYYAGCNKELSQTLLGAQIYRSAKAAENVIKKSINFHIDNPIIVNVELKERSPNEDNEG